MDRHAPAAKPVLLRPTGMRFDTVGNAMPPPVPSGYIDRSTPMEWAAWWRRYPDGTGPLPRKEATEWPARRFDFSAPNP